MKARSPDADEDAGCWCRSEPDGARRHLTLPTPPTCTLLGANSGSVIPWGGSAPGAPPAATDENKSTKT